MCLLHLPLIASSLERRDVRRRPARHPFPPNASPRSRPAYVSTARRRRRPGGGPLCEAEHERGCAAVYAKRRSSSAIIGISSYEGALEAHSGVYHQTLMSLLYFNWLLIYWSFGLVIHELHLKMSSLYIYIKKIYTCMYMYIHLLSFFQLIIPYYCQVVSHLHIHRRVDTLITCNNKLSKWS